MNFDKILEAIDIMMNEKIKKLKFNYVLDGTITEVINPNTYKINVLDNVETLNSMNSNQYLVGDIVYVIVFNNNYSDKKILCKR